MTRIKPVIAINSWGADIDLDYDERTDRITWNPKQANHLWFDRREVHPDWEMLSDFVRLNRWLPRRILPYIRNRGVLGICEHNLPASHSLSSLYMFEGEAAVRCNPSGWPNQCWEPLETWRQLSRLMQALWRIGYNLRENVLGQPEDWRIVFSGNPNVVVLLNQTTIPVKNWKIGQEYVEPVWEREVNIEWQIIENAIRVFFSWGGVGISFRKTEGQSSVVLDSPGLFGALAIELMYSLFSEHRLETCSACGRIYFPIRAPRPGEESYCSDPECKKVMKQRIAKKYRKRRKA